MKVSALILWAIVLPISVSAAILNPYVVDEKPRVLFGDSIVEDSYYGLENYAYEYVNGYLHITFTYTHGPSFPGYPAVLYITGSDPRSTSTPEVIANEVVFELRPYDGGIGAPSGWYTYDIQFHETHYHVTTKRYGVSVAYEFDKAYSGSAGQWAALANHYPLPDPANPSEYSMAFTPIPIRQQSVEECCSSILFIPGIKTSRLYENGEKLWEPDGESDVQALYLDGQGKSISSNIAVGEVIDTFDGPFFFNPDIYKSLLADLEMASTTGTIADYAAVPYDWRLSIPDILANGSIEDTLRSLAASSQTGKVSIITHSNGALVAKVLINELGTDASDLVDQMIFIAAPQLGTPQAIGTLLHGFDAGIALTYSDEREREFANNAPTAYQLLPHADYDSNSGFSIYIPLISFKSGASTGLFTNLYGTSVDSASELSSFILGAEGRNTPHYLDLESPAIGNTALLTAVETLHSSIGSSWTPPEGVIVHQIAGTGENTLAGITYSSGRGCIRALITGLPSALKLVCLEYGEKLIYTPNEMVNGDGTVVVPSALAMSTSTEQVRRWWVDLQRYNSFFEFNIDRDHKNFLEIPEVRALIFNNILAGASTPLPKYLHGESPELEDKNRLRFILHSPLKLSVTDNEGNEISETTATIPGAAYKRYGEVQVVWVPQDAFPTLHLTGVEDGFFTLEAEEYAGDTLTTAITFSGIPSSASSLVSMGFPDGTIQNAGNLILDYDGNGTTDLALTPEEGETVTLPEPSLSELLAILKELVNPFYISEKLKKNLVGHVERIEKKIEKKKQQNQKILDRLEKRIDKKAMKGKIDLENATTIINLLEELEAQIEGVSLDESTLQELKEAISALDLKQNQKDQLLKRIRRLENVKHVTNTLSNLEAKIIKKGDKGIIDGEDVQEMLKLLKQIEQMI